MAVVINDFEVAPPREAPKERGSAAIETGSDEKSPAEDHEIGRLVEHQLRRCERVWAH